MTQNMKDLQECIETMRDGSKSFFAASRILPQRVRDPATALYAFCRITDDVADAVDAQPDAIPKLRERLDRIYQGTPDDIAADRALSIVVKEFDLPISLPLALIEGYEWDTQFKTYDSLEDLLDYCARVAGTVGAMMCVIMDRREPETLARACELGLAMQLTNIARDVGEDAANGRIYLPLNWFREVGLDPEVWLQKPEFNEQIASVIARLLKHADVLYSRAEDGISDLPWDCRPAIQAARLIYSEIGRQVEKLNLDSISTRAYVPSKRKVVLLAEAFTAISKIFSKQHQVDADKAIQYLVDAVTEVPHEKRFEGTTHDHLLWFVDLMERQERRRNPRKSGRALQ
jgi:phytoene synthase